jgi:hypothetical protein
VVLNMAAAVQLGDLVHFAQRLVQLDLADLTHALHRQDGTTDKTRCCHLRAANKRNAQTY